MKIVVSTDWHLHTWAKFGQSDGKGVTKRMRDQLLMLDLIAGVVKDHDAVHLFGGDLYHKPGSPPIECVNFAYECSDLGGVCFGNHDLARKSSSQWYHSSSYVLRKLAEAKNLDVFSDHKIKFIDYDMDVDYREVVGYDLVIAHKTPVGAIVGGYTFEDGVDWKRLAKNNKLVLFGHIHQHQVLADNCVVVGSPMQLTFGEIGDRGVVVVDTDTWSWEFVPLDLPRFVTVDYVSEVKDDTNYYRVLKAEKRGYDGNVQYTVVPAVFEERIASTDNEGILREWLELQGNPAEAVVLLDEFAQKISDNALDVFRGVLAKVEVTNFMSIGQASYEVESGLTFINGVNEDRGGSNGSGKSSLVGDSVLWGLFGVTAKGLRGVDVVRKGLKDCSVKLHLDLGGKRFVVVRSHSKGLALLDPKGVDLYDGLRKPDRQTRFESEFLKFNKDLFQMSCYFSQENIILFTALGDSEKTNIITRLLGFDVYDVLYKDCSDMIKECDREVSDIASEKEQLLEKLRGIKQRIFDLEGSIQASEDEKTSFETMLGSVVADLKEAKVALAGLVEESGSVEDVSLLEKKISVKWAEKADLEKAGLVKTASAAELDAKLLEVKNELNLVGLNLNKVEETRGLFTRKIAELASEKEGIECEYCGSTVTKESLGRLKAKYEAEVSDCSDKDTGLRKQQDEVKGRLATYQIERQQLCDKVSEGLAGVKVLVADVDSLKESVLAKKLEKEKAASAKRVMDQKIDGLVARMSEYEGLLATKESEIAGLSDKEATLYDETGILKKTLLAKERESEAVAKRADGYKFWKTAFSAKGIRSVLLDRFCNEFNEFSNRLISDMSNGFMRLVMSPMDTLKSGDSRNKIGFEIYQNETMLKYEQLSGGEKRVVDCAICLAFNHWISAKYGLARGLFGLLIFDELFSFIDTVGEEAIGSLLAKEGFDKAIFLITHTPELSSYASRVWDVVKKESVSKLVGA